MSTDERAVLGDQLQQRGEPQGELIALQLALEALPADAPRVRRAAIERRIATCLDQHHDAFYGALAPHVQRLSRPDLRDPALAVRRWSGGFADELWLQSTLAGPALPAIVRIAGELPICRFVRRLQLEVGDHPGALAELARAPWPTLRELIIDNPFHFTPWLPQANLVDFHGVERALAQLESLRVVYHIEYRTFESPSLRAVALSQLQHDAWAMPGTVFDARLPALEELRLAGFRIEVGLFERYPRLRRLTVGGPVELAWLEYLIASPHLARLTHLTLGHGLHDDGVAWLVRHAQAFAHLEIFDAGMCIAEPDVIAAARAHLPACVKLR